VFWFLNSLIRFHVANGDGADGISVLESRAPAGDSPPYHIHHSEDECFHVLEGELVLLVDGEARRLRAGDTYLAPKGVPHTYRVVSEEARLLVVTTKGDFERVVRAVSRPAHIAELPVPAGPPTAEEQRELADLARRHAIELIGPPLAEEVARAA